MSGSVANGLFWPELLPYALEKALPPAALTVMPAPVSFSYTPAKTLPASLLMPESSPRDRLMTSGLMTSASSSAASRALSGIEPSSSEATLATTICAWGAVPCRTSALAAAIAVTCVPWDRSFSEWGTTSASLSA